MYTITILMYLTLITMVGLYYMQKAAFRYLTRYVEKSSAPVPTPGEEELYPTAYFAAAWKSGCSF